MVSQATKISQGKEQVKRREKGGEEGELRAHVNEVAPSPVVPCSCGVDWGRATNLSKMLPVFRMLWKSKTILLCLGYT